MILLWDHDSTLVLIKNHSVWIAPLNFNCSFICVENDYSCFFYSFFDKKWYRHRHTMQITVHKYLFFVIVDNIHMFPPFTWRLFSFSFVFFCSYLYHMLTSENLLPMIVFLFCTMRTSLQLNIYVYFIHMQNWILKMLFFLLWNKNSFN